MTQDLRLIDKAVLKEGVNLINGFSVGLNKLGQTKLLSKKEMKELHDKIFKGNEATVANFVDENDVVKEKLSEALGIDVVGFNLSFNPHGTDGYLETREGKYIPVEIKTTTGKLVPKNNRQRRKSDADVNVQYTAAFKFHFTSTDKPFADEFAKELANFDNGQVTILAGLYDNDCGVRQVADIFAFNSDQSKDLLNWGREFRCNEKLIQYDPTLFMNGGRLDKHGTYIVSTKPNDVN